MSIKNSNSKTSKINNSLEHDPKSVTDNKPVLINKIDSKHMNEIKPVSETINKFMVVSSHSIKPWYSSKFEIGESSKQADIDDDDDDFADELIELFDAEPRPGTSSTRRNDIFERKSSFPKRWYERNFSNEYINYQQTSHVDAVSSDTSIGVNLFNLDEAIFMHEGFNSPTPISERSSSISVEIFHTEQEFMTFEISGNTKRNDDNAQALESLIKKSQHIKFGEAKPEFNQTIYPFPQIVKFGYEPNQVLEKQSASLSDSSEKQVEQAKREFEEDELNYALMFRPREWKKRRNEATSYLYTEILLVPPEVNYLMYNTPVQILHDEESPENGLPFLIYALSLSMTPESLYQGLIFISQNSTTSLSLDISPMNRNVFEIISCEKNMQCWPVVYNSTVCIKVHCVTDETNFFLSCKNIKSDLSGCLYVTDTCDKFCKFEIKPISTQFNGKFAKIQYPIVFRHLVSGSYIVANTSMSTFNICGEEQLVHISRQYLEGTQYWTLSHGAPFCDLISEYSAGTTASEVVRRDIDINNDDSVGK